MEELLENLIPLYNKEFYLSYLCGENVVLPIPDGNAERYLAYLCGMDVTIPDVPDGRTETYLAYKCGEDVVLPDPLYRIEFYLAKWCGVDCEVPEPMYRIEYWLAQLANSGELKTVTGNPISVSDALAKPAESLSIEILPSQDLHGYSNPWPAGGGVNVVDFESIFTDGWTNETGGLKAIYSKGYMTITGTNETAGWVNIVSFNTQWSSNPLVLPAGSYTVPSNLMLSSSVDNGAYANKTGTITATDSLKIRGFYIAVNTGQTVNWTIPMVVARGTTAPTTFYPYSNICPISGWSNVKVTRTGKNLLNPDKATSTSGNKVKYYFANNGERFLLKKGVTYRFCSKVFVDGLYITNVENNTNYATIYGQQVLTYTPTADIRVGFNAYWAISNLPSGGLSADLLYLIVDDDTAYEPYTGTTYSISWQDEAGTVYGGTLDVTTGVMTVTHKYYTYNGSENWGITGNQLYLYIFGVEGSKSNEDTSQISNLFVGGGSSYGDYGKFRVQTNGAVCVGNRISEGVYNWNTKDEFKTFLSSNNLQICYELATPLTIQLTATQVDMLLGNNVLWNDVDGDMTLEYLADGPADDVDALQILLGNRYVNNGAEDEATDREALEILLGGNTR